MTIYGFMRVRCHCEVARQRRLQEVTAPITCSPAQTLPKTITCRFYTELFVTFFFFQSLANRLLAVSSYSTDRCGSGIDLLISSLKEYISLKCYFNN